eukprot:6398251-Prymnesium_polylepis.1
MPHATAGTRHRLEESPAIGHRLVVEQRALPRVERHAARLCGRATRKNYAKGRSQRCNARGRRKRCNARAEPGRGTRKGGARRASEGASAAGRVPCVRAQAAGHALPGRRAKRKRRRMTARGA